jgi:hypothetical protein
MRVTYTRVSLLIVSLVLIGCFGCGMQQGRYTVTGNTYRAFAERVGGIDIVDGVANTPLDTTDAGSPDLLYITIAGPRLHLHGTSINRTDGRIISVFDFSWNSELGSLGSSMQWNRETDIVSIGKREFDRQKGNSFLITIDSHGVCEARQVSNFVTHCSFQEVLKRTREQTPNDNPIHSSELAK